MNLKYKKVKKLYKKAVENVKKVYREKDFYDFTDIEIYIAEFITGIAISESNFERLCELANN